MTPSGSTIKGGVPFEEFERLLRMETVTAMFQEEMAPSTGKFHLQGFLSFREKRRPMGVFKIDGFHWEASRGSQEQNVSYCSKGDSRVPGGRTFAWGLDEPIDILRDDQLYPWQREVVEICKTRPDTRTINWYWEPVGARGKTALCRKLVVEYNAMLIDGSVHDITSRLVLMKENKEPPPKIILMNLVRGQEEYSKHVYRPLETVKDGIVSSGKFKGGQWVFNSPHVFVFANFAPDMYALSVDRWHIVELGEEVIFNA